jgi:hypothetical protein
MAKRKQSGEDERAKRAQGTEVLKRVGRGDDRKYCEE